MELVSRCVECGLAEPESLASLGGSAPGVVDGILSILGKSTEDTSIELDGEGAANYEQLKDLIRKECDKRDCKYARLEDKYNKLEQQVTHKDQQKNMAQRG